MAIDSQSAIQTLNRVGRVERGYFRDRGPDRAVALNTCQKSDQSGMEMLTFSPACAAQFRYFKDAWRNHVAHMRKDYGAGDAWQTLVHVRDFMELLSARLHE